jgi:tape measure domain-containing protein
MADPTLKIRVTGDLTAIRTSLASLQKDLVALGQKGTQAGATTARGVSRMETSLKRASFAAKGLIVSLAGIVSVRAFTQIADQAALLTARLRLATQTQQEFNRAQAGTFEIAQRTRTSLQTTVDLYARLERSTRDLGIAQGELLQLTESINQAGQLSGGGVGVEAGLVQLAQGLQSGKLAGDELRSVLEQIPRLAEAIRTGLTDLGVEGAKDLRKLAQEGTLTPELVLQAILQQKDILAREFAQLPETVGGAFTRIQNSITQAFGEVDRALGASRGLAGALSDVAEFITNLDFSFFIESISSSAAAFDTLATSIGRTVDTIVNALGPALNRGEVRTGLDFFSFTLRNLPAIVIGAIQRVTVEFAAFGDRLLANGRLIRDAFKAIFTDLTIAGNAERFAREIKAIEDTRQASIDAIRDEVDANIAAGEAAGQRYRTEREERRKAAEEARRLQGQGGRIGGGQGSAAQAAVDDAALLQDSIERALRELDRLYKAGEVGLQEYFARKQQLQQQAIDSEIAQSRAELATASSIEQKSKVLTKIALLERQRAAIGPTIALEQADAERELARALEDVRARLAEVNGDQTAQQRLQLTREREQLLRQFSGDEEASGLINRLFDVELARTRVQQIEGEAQQLLERLRQGEDNIAVQIEAGTLGQVTGEEQLQSIRERTIEQLQRLRDALIAAYNERPDEQTKAAIQSLDTEIARVTASANQLRNDIRDLGQSSLEGFFNDIATGAASAGEAVRNLVLTFIQGLARMAAEALAKRAILSLTGLFGGGAGTVPVGVAHGGGWAGQGMKRAIPAGLAAAMFAVAPRFHSGGIAGLNPGEVPAILQTGERVLSRQESARYSEGDRPAPGTRVVNVFDPSFVPDQMDSADGERVILNVIGRTPGRVKQLLG